MPLRRSTRRYPRRRRRVRGGMNEDPKPHSFSTTTTTTTTTSLMLIWNKIEQDIENIKEQTYDTYPEYREEDLFWEVVENIPELMEDIIDDTIKNLGVSKKDVAKALAYYAKREGYTVFDDFIVSQGIPLESDAQNTGSDPEEPQPRYNIYSEDPQYAGGVHRSQQSRRSRRSRRSGRN